VTTVRAVGLALGVLLAGCHAPEAEHDASVAYDLAVPDGGPDAGACGTRSGMRGLTHRTLAVAGLERTYLVYLPMTAIPTTPLPFVYVFHGYTQSGQEMYDITRYSDLADQEGIAVVFPDGEAGPLSTGAPWNVKDPGQDVCGYGNDESATGDDLDFVDLLRDDVSQDQCLDAAHTYATGFSMGAYLTEHLGCVRSDLRAIGPHSGGTLADLSSCTSGHVPIILFHGTNDSLISDACDDPTRSPDGNFPAAATLWAKKNGCAGTYTTIPANGAGGGTGQCFVYDGCPADGQVELCTFNGMGHCWAGGGVDFNYCSTWASATQLEWAFFKKYAW